ncbi:hypothetical protein ACLF6K_13420 [Streptomyces xanthophaeus]|uniref:hypothetical protein n=1 Tax=Streptomyces xanthophaeus TaxID=67385 RepID=UPI00398FC6AA
MPAVVTGCDPRWHARGSGTASAVESLDVVARRLRDRLNAAAVSFLIVDFTGSSVVRLGAADSVESGEPPERVALPGTLSADALRTQRPALQREGNSRVRVVAPVTNRGDAIGLLELFLPDRPDEDAMRQIGATAHALAYIVIANRSFTDVYQWGRRTRPLNLHPREASRALVAEILHAHGGRLQDDATVMCLDWHGSHQVTRSADAGADLAEASAPE